MKERDTGFARPCARTAGRSQRARRTSSGSGSESTRRQFAQACDAAGIAVRPFAGEGARVSIGTPAANDAFLAVASAFPHRV